MKAVLHLVDDAKPGGVQRVLDHLARDERLGHIARHDVVLVKKGAWTPPRAKVDAVVSHLSVCWRNFPFFVALRATYAHCPLIHVEHSYSRAFEIHNVKRPDRFRALMIGSYALFDRIVAVSQGQANWLVETGAAPAAKLKTIRSCVGLNRFLAMPPKPRDSRLVVGAIGRLDRQKGFANLIRAMAQVNPNTAELQIWGDGPEKAALSKLADPYPHVTMMGYVADPVLAYGATDVVAVPSLWEPYGLVALEARAAARPIIVSAADGLPEQARDSGLIVQENGAEEDWADAIRQVAKIDLATLRDTARFSADGAEEAFITGWRSLLENVLSGAPDAEQTAA